MPDALLARCGQLIAAGFGGTQAPPELLHRIAEGRVGWVILFARNITGPEQLAALCRTLREAAPPPAPLAIAVDQEGGRVQRFPAPWPRWPAARQLGSRSRETLVAVGQAMGEEIAAAGIQVNLAPVLDVDTNPNNPVIGDRAYGPDVETVIRAGSAYAEGLMRSGVQPCGKHFPGHGDTHLDSHIHLPVVSHPKSRLEAVELAPFAALAPRLPAIMSAHVVFTAFDPDVPATLSRTLLSRILRARLAFGGVLFSDDMEMKAVADRYSPEDLAVRSVWAGVDVLSVCHDRARQERMLSALVRQAAADPDFRMQVDRAAHRIARFKAGLRVGLPDPARCRAVAERSGSHRLAASLQRPE